MASLGEIVRKKDAEIEGLERQLREVKAERERLRDENNGLRTEIAEMRKEDKRGPGRPRKED